MIISVLYTNSVVGLNYIQDPELLFVNIFRVAVEGLQYTQVEGDPGNLEFRYEDSTGRVYFATAFEYASKIMVKYQGSGEVVATCTPVSGSIDLPNGTYSLIGLAYNYSVDFAGTLPFELNVITKPPWMTITLDFSTLHFTGVPDSAGDSPVEFTLTNCEGGTEITVTDTVHIDPMPPDPPDPGEGGLVATSSTAFSQMNTITGFTYVLTDGYFPVTSVRSITGEFTPFTGAISVYVQTAVGGRITLRRNGVLLQTISYGPFSSGIKTFSSYTFADGDEIVLNLEL